MTSTEQDVPGGGSPFGADATANLWLHFTRMSVPTPTPRPR